MSGCCDPRGCEDMFGPRFARHLASRYRKRGLDKTAARMIAYLVDRGIDGASVLEIGGGVGDIQLELLGQGASRTTNLELVDAYDTDATKLAETAGMRDRITRRQLDIAATPDEVEAHDIVVLHRVVCCYPDYERLLTAAADHAKRVLVFSHPRRNWMTRTFTRLQNVGFRLIGKSFQIFAHPPAAMVAVAEGRGMRSDYTHRSGLAGRRPRASELGMTNGEVTDRLRSLWERYAPRYDRDTGFYDVWLLGDSRSWACSQASGHVLEVAIGTGRNLPFYPRGIQLTGIDFSPAMLEIARDRAAELALDVNLIEADAQRLPFVDDRFDAVVCTLALSTIPDPAAAINEMYRVLHPGGQLLVVGHVASPYRVVRAGQRRLERLSIRLAGDHQTRQPYPEIVAAGFTVDRRERLKAGVLERVRAVKPTGR